jgi:hypothetical protein
MADVPFVSIDYLAEARSRISEQFKNKDVIDRLLQLVIFEQQEIQQVFQDLLKLRDIDSATGAQLDIIGDIVGQPRDLINTDLINYFAFLGYPTAEGYGDINNASLGGYYYDIRNPLAGNTLLSDDQYRLFIKAKIIKNNTSVTPNQFLDFIKFVFGANVSSVIAEGDAEFTVLIGKQLSPFERALLTYESYISGYRSTFIPKPVGVRINFGQFPEEDFFAFQGVAGAKGYGSLGSQYGYGKAYGMSYGDSGSAVTGGGTFASLY